MDSMRRDANQREPEGGSAPPLAQVEADVLAFLRAEAGFAQVFTVNASGYPVGRTMGVLLGDDWSVDLVQRRVHRRLGHLLRNPRVEVVWVGSPAPGSTNDHPHVFDFGLLVPRCVFLRGDAQVMDDDWTLERYRREDAELRSRGLTKAPERTDDEVRAELVGVHIRPVQVRAEGFGRGAESFTWSPS
jgi:hypothetical protein